jgi:hypothetical protein
VFGRAKQLKRDYAAANGCGIKRSGITARHEVKKLWAVDQVWEHEDERGQKWLSFRLDAPRNREIMPPFERGKLLAAMTLLLALYDA